MGFAVPSSFACGGKWRVERSLTASFVANNSFLSPLPPHLCISGAASFFFCRQSTWREEKEGGGGGGRRGEGSYNFEKGNGRRGRRRRKYRPIDFYCHRPSPTLLCRYTFSLASQFPTFYIGENVIFSSSLSKELVVVVRGRRPFHSKEKEEEYKEYSWPFSNSFLLSFPEGNGGRREKSKLCHELNN